MTIHADAHHIGGHAAVIELSETEGDGVGTVYDPGIASNSQTYGDDRDAIEEHDVTLYGTGAGNRIPFESVETAALMPADEYLADGERNENSIGMHLAFGASSFLFPGDADDAGEEYLVDEYGTALNATVLQAGHHGSRSSSSDTFLDETQSRLGVISDGYASQYGPLTMLITRVCTYYPRIEQIAMENQSRRRFLRLGSLGLATGIAECNTTTDRNTPDRIDGPNNTPPSGDDTEPDGASEPRPETPPAIFKGYNSDFTFQDLPLPPEHFGPGLGGTTNDPSFEHPGNMIFTVDIDEATAHVTLEQTRLTRAIILTLRIRDENGNMQTVDHRLELATGGYQTYEVDFDISEISLPQSVGGFCELVGRDTHEHARDDYLLTRHQFVGIPYNNGVRWINSETFQVTRSERFEGMFARGTPRGVSRNGELIESSSTPSGAIDYIDEDNERVVFLAVRNTVNEEVYGVSCTIDKSAYNDYKTGNSRYRNTHAMRYECRKANQITHLRELGRKLDDILTRLGITTPRERLEALGDLVQMIPYKVHDFGHPPTLVLYEAEGDCYTKAGLFSAITQTDSWNTNTSFITCTINGGDHVTTAIDVNEFDEELDPNNVFTVSPTNEQITEGYRDTSYAFFDMTYDSTIGHRGGSVGGPIAVYDEGDHAHTGDEWVASESPDY